MFQISNQWLLFSIDVSIKAALIALVAGLTLTCLKLRNPDVRHRVWSSVLVGMLALPILALLLPAIPLSFPASLARLTQSDSGLSSILNSGASENGTANAIPSVTHLPLSPNRTPGQAGSNPRESAVLPHDLAVSSAMTPIDSLVEGTSAVTTWSFSDSLRIVSSVLFVGWVLVSLSFVTRLLIGLMGSAGLLRRATQLTDARIQKCVAGLPNTFAWNTASVYETREVHVPVTIGWFRPSVLLPTEWKTWSDEKLSAIIAHELTHVVRRDFLIAFAAELNRCLYWFHPVSWWLRSQLSDLAEEACDDAAIGHTGDRTGYARHLLEVAERLGTSCGQRVQPGLSMASASNVESRITTILDFTRPLSTRMSWRTAVVIAILTVPVVAAAAAVRPVDQTAHPSHSQETDQLATDKVAESDATIRVRGQVTDSDGNPIPNASVKLWRSWRTEWYAADLVYQLVSTLSVDVEGRFDQQVPRDRLPAGNIDGEAWSVLSVSAPGYGHRTLVGDSKNHTILGEQFTQPNFLNESVAIELPSAVTVRGRLVSTEGKPVVGAKVTLHQILQAQSGNQLDTWLQQVTSTELRGDITQSMMPMMTEASISSVFPGLKLYVPPESVAPVFTDANGTFEMNHLIGQDDVAVLRFTGERIVDKTAHVLGRQVDSVFGPQSLAFSPAGIYYGREFRMVAAPSVPVFGVIRDLESKAPLAGVSVAVSEVYGGLMSHDGYIRTVTDSEGRYRIEGLPIPPQNLESGRGNYLILRFAKRACIELDSLPIPIGDGAGPIEFDIEVCRAVMVKGRLTNGATGEPIAAADIYYAPYASNENTNEFRRYRDPIVSTLGNETRYHTDEDGRFEMPVIPGRGVISAKVRNGVYVTGFGAESIEAFRNLEGGLSTMLADLMTPSSFHSLVEIDVAADAETHEVEMHVDNGSSLVVRFIDQNGEPLAGGQCKGLGTRRRWTAVEDDHANMDGLSVGNIRSLHVVHEKRQLARLVRIVPQLGQKEAIVQLLPLNQVKGQLVDSEGHPLANVFIGASHNNRPEVSDSISSVQTDEEGRFLYHLPVGVEYHLTATNLDGLVMLVSDALDLKEPVRIDLGELTMDENAERYTLVKAKRDPIVTKLSNE